MTATEIVECLLANEQVDAIRLSEAKTCQQMAHDIVQSLLGDDHLLNISIGEASVHRHGSRIWQAVFTGPAGGPLWRSTGTADYNQALRLAKKWEAKARTERIKLGRSPRKPLLRVSRSQPSSGIGPYSQREVALLLNISERAVREIERRAIEKLRRNPLLREIWKDFGGKMEEGHLQLTAAEISALFSLAQNPEETRMLDKTLRLIERPGASLGI